MPGRIPIRTPMIDDLRKFHFSAKNSFREKPKPFIFVSFTFPATFFCFTEARSNNSATANNPTNTATRSNPPSREWLPNVNLGSPSIGAPPIMERRMPRRPLINPFM